MHVLKSATPETLKTLAGYIADLLNTNIRGTSGSAAAINANAGMFDVVLNPFNAQDLSSAGFEDVPETHEKYSAVMDVVAAGYMAPAGETVFGVDEEATVGDFLGGLYLLIGGTGMDAQACLDVLAENGLADASQDLNAPLTEKYLCDLLTSIGAQMTTDTPDHIMTRGELAELFVMLIG